MTEEMAFQACKRLDQSQAIRPELMSGVLRRDLQCFKGFFGSNCVSRKCWIRHDANEACLHEWACRPSPCRISTELSLRHCMRSVL